MHPDRNVGIAVFAGLAQCIDVFSARRHLVDVILDDTGGNHGQRGQCETSSDLLDRRKHNSCLAKTRIDNEVHDRNNDDDEDRVKLSNNIVRRRAEVHCAGLRYEIVKHLVVGQEVERV